MTTQTLHRYAPLDLERSNDGDGRTIVGIIAPFNVAAVVRDAAGPAYRESFRPGSFAETIKQRGHKVKLMPHHNSRTNPLGRATLLREDAAGVYGEFHVSKTVAGDEVLELVRDGALDAFSVGFAPTRSEKSPAGVIERTEVILREVSLVNVPAYEGAAIEAVREVTELPSGLSIVEARRILEAIAPEAA